MRKIDDELKKVLALENNDKKINCLIYVNDLNYAKNFAKQNNIKIVNTFNFINAIAVSINHNKIFELANEKFVKFISSSAKVTTLVNVAKKIMRVKNLNCTGKNVGIAFIDTGIFTHIDFMLRKNRVVKFVDLINGSEKPYDDNGHGTFVSGVCCGSGLVSNKKFSGFAPNADIISIKALDKKGEADAIRILEAMQWVYDNCKVYNIKVVCMSFGSQPLGYNDPIMKGADKLWQKGIIVVAAAGNSGPDFQTIKSPGISGKIITVGGFNDNRIDEDINDKFFEIAKFSSRGPALSRAKPDLVAPSVDIISCDKKGGYTALSGTSVATPMIAGICALILEKNPNLSPDQVKRILLNKCRGITYNKYLEGWGYPIF